MATLGGLLCGCGLAQRPYVAQRRWPLLVQRPQSLPALPGGRILEVRALSAGPGLENDGLQRIRADGSLETGFYERWAVPPADAVTSSLRLWLSQSGRFAAVVSQGSRAVADVSLEGEVTVLNVDLGTNMARAAIALTAVATSGRRALVQTTCTGQARTGEGGAAAQVRAQVSALAEVFACIEGKI